MARGGLAKYTPDRMKQLIILLSISQQILAAAVRQHHQQHHQSLLGAYGGYQYQQQGQ
jgi:hypothetical protein